MEKYKLGICLSGRDCVLSSTKYVPLGEGMSFSVRTCSNCGGVWCGMKRKLRYERFLVQFMLEDGMSHPSPLVDYKREVSLAAGVGERLVGWRAPSMGSHEGRVLVTLGRAAYLMHRITNGKIWTQNP